jgi:hypothetical protein
MTQHGEVSALKLFVCNYIGNKPPAQEYYTYYCVHRNKRLDFFYTIREIYKHNSP